MAWALVAGAAISGGVAAYKGIKGAQQTREANDLARQNPGFRVNQNVIDNAKTLSDYYGNYQLPGYGQLAGNINSSYASAFGNGVKGASSSNDILDLATKMAYGKNQAFNQLGVQNAQGKQSAMDASLNANVAAGQQYQDQNAYDRDQYQQQLRQKAALTQAGAENTYGAIDQIAGAAGKFAFSQAGTGDGTTAVTPANYSGNPASGANSTINNLWNKYYSGNPSADTGMFSTSF